MLAAFIYSKAYLKTYECESFDQHMRYTYVYFNHKKYTNRRNKARNEIRKFSSNLQQSYTFDNKNINNLY